VWVTSTEIAQKGIATRHPSDRCYSLALGSKGPLAFLANLQKLATFWTLFEHCRPYPGGRVTVPAPGGAAAYSLDLPLTADISRQYLNECYIL